MKREVNVSVQDAIGAVQKSRFMGNQGVLKCCCE